MQTITKNDVQVLIQILREKGYKSAAPFYVKGGIGGVRLNPEDVQQLVLSLMSKK